MFAARFNLYLQQLALVHRQKAAAGVLPLRLHLIFLHGQNLSGIILIDFIDMQQPEDQELVLQTLEKALQSDPVKTNVLGLTHA